MFNLALLLQRTNKHSEAADYWRRYLAHDGQSEWALRRLHTLPTAERMQSRSKRNQSERLVPAVGSGRIDRLPIRMLARGFFDHSLDVEMAHSRRAVGAAHFRPRGRSAASRRRAQTIKKTMLRQLQALRLRPSLWWYFQRGAMALDQSVKRRS
jgi:hypothetical protein